MSKDTELLLPLGSVVKLKGGEAPLLITSYMPNDTSKNNKYYDYEGNIFPIGRYGDKLFLFNVDDIEEVLFIGYQTDDSLKYRRIITTVRKYLKEGMPLPEAVKKATEQQQ